MDWVESKKLLNEDLLYPLPALTASSPAPITPLPDNIFPHRLAPSA